MQAEVVSGRGWPEFFPTKCLCSVGVAPLFLPCLACRQGSRTLSPAVGDPYPLVSPGLCWVVKDAASLLELRRDWVPHLPPPGGGGTYS